MTVVDEIKARIDIVDLVSETVKLRRAGKNYTGFCPFHTNTRTPAFVIFPESGTWRCFGQCNEGGDIFRFVMKKEGLDFPQALQVLAQRAGVELEPPSPEKQVVEEQHERLRTLLEDAVTFYRHNLLQTPAGKTALEYLKKRGLTQATIETFGLGYAPDSWDVTTHYFLSRGFSVQELQDTGMVSARDSGGVYDRFRHRVMFPIRDGTGRMAGFGARILNPDDVPKFLNSPQTVLFDKGRLLYGLDQARKAIRSEDQVVIVEGYLDVIVLHQGGFTNTVSPMGTALGEDQLHMLKRLTRRIVLALDADAAGEKATLRGLEVARQSMDRTDEIAFDARGLLRHEARLQADLRVTTLPEGMDPDEVVLRDPQEWSKILQAAQPIVVHVMETLAANHDLEDPKAKSEIAAQILPLIEDVPNAIERDTYRQRLARLLRVDERSLLASQPVSHSPRKAARPTRPATAQDIVAELAGGPARRLVALEQHVIHLLLREPEILYMLDRVLQREGLSRFGVHDFEQADMQVFARLIMQSLEQEHMDHTPYIELNLPESLEDSLEELKSMLVQGEPATDKVLEELVRTVAALRKARINNEITQMRFLQEDLENNGEDQMESYRALMMQYTQALARLNRILGQPVHLD